MLNGKAQIGRHRSAYSGASMGPYIVMYIYIYIHLGIGLGAKYQCAYRGHDYPADRLSITPQATHVWGLSR